MNKAKVIVAPTIAIIILAILASMILDLEHTNVKINYENGESETFVWSHKSGIEPYRLTFIEEDHKHLYLMPNCQSIVKSTTNEDSADVDTNIVFAPMLSVRLQWEWSHTKDKPKETLHERFIKLEHCLITEPKQIALLDYLWITI